MGKQKDKSDLPGYKVDFDHPWGGMRLDDPNCEEPNGAVASVENNSTSLLQMSQSPCSSFHRGKQ
jgi:hypothetical protein